MYGHQISCGGAVYQHMGMLHPIYFRQILFQILYDPLRIMKIVKSLYLRDVYVVWAGAFPFMPRHVKGVYVLSAVFFKFIM
jgi:hypothetical protein